MWRLTGATLWARKTLESDIYFNKPDKWFKIWFFIVQKTNFQDNKQFKRGECFTSYDEIRQFTGATKNEIDHCMRWLKSATMVRSRKATRGMYVGVLNYKPYQDVLTYKSDSKSDTGAKQKRNTSDTIQKNDNNENKNSLYSQLLRYWNEQDIIIHKSLTKETKKIVDTKLKEYTLEEINTAIYNYGSVLHHPNTIFSYKWTLAEFLKRGNALPVFLEKTLEDYLGNNGKLDVSERRKL